MPTMQTASAPKRRLARKHITRNGKVVRETIGTGNSAKVLDFIYDNSGKPFALKYSTNGGSSFTTCYYVVNLQGDVVKLVNAIGLSMRIAFSTTDIDSVLASNMFAYCENNPVLCIDPNGEFFFTIIGAAVEAAIKGEDALAGAASGAVSGALTSAAVDLIAVTGGTAVVAVGVMDGAEAIGALAGNATNSAITGEPINWKLGKTCFGELLLEGYLAIWVVMYLQGWEKLLTRD